MIKDNKVQRQIEDILKRNFISFKLQDVLLIIAITNQFNRSGYSLTDVDVTNFLVNKNNIKLIKENGLTKTIEAMKDMRLGSIIKTPQLGRNEKCNCGSGVKFKKCCLIKKNR